ncbi:MAG: hypothetical protein AAGH60_07705 [Pseudomonadota bacterium]
MEAQFVARLQAAVPSEHELTIDDLSTRFVPRGIQFEIVGAHIEGTRLKASLSNVEVELRASELVRGNTTPSHIRVADLDVLELRFTPNGAATTADHNAQAAESQQGERRIPQPTNALSQDEGAAVASSAVERETSQADAPPGDMNADALTMRAYQVLESLDAELREMMSGEPLAGIQRVTIDRMQLPSLPGAALPLLAQEHAFGIEAQRASNGGLVLEASGLDPSTPSVVLEVGNQAESSLDTFATLDALLDGEADGADASYVTRLKVDGVPSSGLTAALDGGGPLMVAADIEMGIILARADAEGPVSFAGAVISATGDLVAGRRFPSRIEQFHLPIIFDPAREEADIRRASLRFEETGGLWSGSIRPAHANGQNGVRVEANASDYRLHVPASDEFDRDPSHHSSEIELTAFISNDFSVIELEKVRLALDDASADLSGAFDLSGDQAVIALAGTTSPMSVEQLQALWPLPIAASARDWFLDSAVEGLVGEGEFRLDANLGEIEFVDGRAFMVDDMLRYDLPFENLVLSTVGDLPTAFGLDGDLRVTGRTVALGATGGVTRLQSGETIALGPIRFRIPDHAEPNPRSALSITMNGATAAFMKLAELDPILIGPERFPFAAVSVSGQTEMTAIATAQLASEMNRDAVEASMTADVVNFALDEPIDGRTIERGRFAVSADEDGVLVVGTAAVNGILTDIDLQPGQGEGASFAMTLDDEEQADLGFDFGTYLDGPVRVTVDPSSADDATTMEIDLRDARIAIPELGWSKPEGVAGQASFDLIERGGLQQIDNLVVAADGLSVRGNLQMDGEGLRNAQFERVILEDVGDFALALTRGSDAIAARLTGDRLVLQPEMLRGDRAAVGNLSLDMEVAELFTQSGAKLSDVAMKFQQNTETITQFELRAKHADGTDLMGTMSPVGAQNQIVVSSGNAGTFLEFLDLYSRAEGGRATLVLEPQAGGGRLAGQLLLNDFVIVNEPAMQRIFNSGARSAQERGGVVLPGDIETPDRIQIEATNIRFERTPERLTIYDAEGWGPSLGGNLEGTINYQTGQMALEGTYVPFFSINNIFSRIPVFGTALGGRENEGLLGVTFKLSGTTSEPRLEVNPMSILAPGAIRSIFEYQLEQ